MIKTLYFRYSLLLYQQERIRNIFLTSHQIGSQSAKTLEEWVYVEMTFKMQCYMHENTLHHIAMYLILAFWLERFTNIRSHLF